MLDLREADRHVAVTWPEADQGRAIRSALGIKDGEIMRGRLADLDQLFICGNMVTGSLENTVFDEDGTCHVNGAPVIPGKVADLSLMPYAVRLEKLGLVCQPLGDLSPLSSHVLLQELSLAGSTVEDLSALTDLPSLTSLHLEHTGVQDLSSLEALPCLKTVTVSRNMLPVRFGEDAGFDILLVP